MAREIEGRDRDRAAVSARFLRGLRGNLRYWLARTAPSSNSISGVADDEAISRLNPDFANMRRAVEMGLTLPETQEEAIALILQCFFWVEKAGHSYLWRPLVERGMGLLPANDVYLRFRLLKQLGQFEREDGELKTAVSTFQQADQLAHRLEGGQAIAEIHMNLAETYRRQHKYALAQEHGEMALAMFNEENGRLRAITLEGLGRVALEQGDLSTAVEFLQKSITLQEAINTLYLHRSYNMLATTYRRQKNYAQSAQLYQKALAQIADTPNERDKINISINLGGLFHEWGKYSEAETVLRQAETIARQQKGLLSSKGMIATSLGCVLQGQNDLGGAESYHQRAIVLYRQVNDRLLLANALGNLAEIYAEWKQNQHALNCLTEALGLLADFSGNAWAQKLTMKYRDMTAVLETAVIHQ